MAEEDQASKTEQPSGKKLAQAKQKGQVVQSQEIKSWGVIFGATLALLFLAPKLANDVTLFSYKFIERPHSIPVDLGHLQLLLIDSTMELAVILAPLIIIVVFLALAVTIAQVGWTFSWEKMRLNWAKFSLLQGVKRILRLKEIITARDKSLAKRVGQFSGLQ